MSSAPGRGQDSFPGHYHHPAARHSDFAGEMDFQNPHGLENMPRTPDHGGLGHYAANPALGGQRLPPPQNLLEGAQYAPDTYRPPSQEHAQYYRPPPYAHGHNVPAYSAPLTPLTSPSHLPYTGPVAYQSYSSHQMAQPPPQMLPSAPPGRLVDGSADARFSQYPPHNMNYMNHSLPQSLPYREFDGGNTPSYGTRYDQQDTPMMEPTLQPEPSRPVAQPSFYGADNAEAAAPAQVPNLLQSNKAQFLGGTNFQLIMRQQPNAARACGFGDRDRRVIDPPPIVELIVTNPNLTQEDVRVYLRYESYVMSCAIFDESGERDSSYMPEEYQHQRRLMGSLVATPFVGLDENEKEGCFFCFSDLSCRTPGSFRLKFTLMMIDPGRAGSVRHFPILAEIKSEAFKVFSAKEFPGMVASSSLAKKLKEQGCIISIKKGNDRGGRGRNPDDSDNDDDEDGEPSHSQRRRRQMRN
ncbi:velvet factor domain-containing protein [Trichoderma austrokoningii]